MQATTSAELNGINLAAAPAMVQLADAAPPAVIEGSGEAEAYSSDSSEEEDGIVPRISALPADLRHVARLLSDPSAPGSSAPDGGQAQAAARGRGRKRARGAAQQQRQHTQRCAAPAAVGGSAAGLTAAGTSEQPWNSPGKDSSANVRLHRSPLWYTRKLSVCLHHGRRAALAVLHEATLSAGGLGGLDRSWPVMLQAWRCEACECWVPRAAGDQSAWRAHVQGIRHRRQALSLLHTGARGTLLVSTFEPAPGACRRCLPAYGQQSRGWVCCLG